MSRIITKLLCNLPSKDFGLAKIMKGVLRALTISHEHFIKAPPFEDSKDSASFYDDEKCL